MKGLFIGAIMMLITGSAGGIEAPAAAAPGSAPAVGAQAAAVNPDLERNKAIVRAAFDIIYGTSVEDIAKIDELVAEDYIQHNPSIAQGREGLRRLLLAIVPGPKPLDPRDTLSVNLIAEGDMVVRQEMRKNGMLVDIFRIENGRLQEHWDAFRFTPGAERIPGF